MQGPHPILGVISVPDSSASRPALLAHLGSSRWWPLWWVGPVDKGDAMPVERQAVENLCAFCSVLTVSCLLIKMRQVTASTHCV